MLFLELLDESGKTPYRSWSRMKSLSLTFPWSHLLDGSSPDLPSWHVNFLLFITADRLSNLVKHGRSINVSLGCCCAVARGVVVASSLWRCRETQQFLLSAPWRLAGVRYQLSSITHPTAPLPTPAHPYPPFDLTGQCLRRLAGHPILRALSPLPRNDWGLITANLTSAISFIWHIGVII